MDLDDARSFLTQHHRAVLHTFRADGSPQLSPVLVGVDGQGHATISSRETAMKVKHLERDPRASLCVFTDAFFGPWIRVDGPAQIVRLPEAMDPLIEYFRRISGEHDDWDAYQRAMEEERRVLIRVTPATIGPEVGG